MTVTTEQYIAEFLTDRKSSIAPKGWSPVETLIPDDQLVQQLRRRDGNVLGVAIFHSGIHPRWTVVFLASSPGRVRIIATHTFWGAIQVKRVGEVGLDVFESLRGSLMERLDCSPTLKRGRMFWGFSCWRGPALQFCTGELMDEQSRFFAEAITPVMNSTQTVFTVWPEKQ